MTPDGLELVKLFERFMPTTYLDAKGLPTIGYGHLIRPGEYFLQPMTEPEALALLNRDMASHERDMLNLVYVPLKSYEQDALASFVFNIGAKQFSTSTIRRLINGMASPTTIAEQFPRWRKSGGVVQRGLIRRRNAEAAKYLGAGPVLCRTIWGVNFA